MKKALFLIFSSIMFFVNSDAKYVLQNNTPYKLKITYIKSKDTKGFREGSSTIPRYSKRTIGAWKGVKNQGTINIMVGITPTVLFDISLKRGAGVSTSYKFKFPSFSDFKTYREVDRIRYHKGYNKVVGKMDTRDIVLSLERLRPATDGIFELNLR